jgi:hypothetical protein
LFVGVKKKERKEREEKKNESMARERSLYSIFINKCLSEK